MNGRNVQQLMISWLWDGRLHRGLSGKIVRYNQYDFLDDYMHGARERYGKL